MLKNIARLLREQLKERRFEYGDIPAETVTDFLYISYSEISRSDPEDITQGFADLDRFLDRMSFEESTEAFTNICRLCLAYEKRAFLDGLYLGAQLMLDLQA
jgi:hypothetical protein